MSQEQAVLEIIKSMAQFGISAVFIWAWFQERQINVGMVNAYMRLREKEVELEKTKLEVQLVTERRHLLQTDLNPDRA